MRMRLFLLLASCLFPLFSTSSLPAQSRDFMRRMMERREGGGRFDPRDFAERFRGRGDRDGGGFGGRFGRGDFRGGGSFGEGDFGRGGFGRGDGDEGERGRFGGFGGRGGFGGFGGRGDDDDEPEWDFDRDGGWRRSDGREENDDRRSRSDERDDEDEKSSQPKARKRVNLALPGEYAAGDLDRDGQVGLYEWRRWKSRSALAEFLALDRNHDGFLTPRELRASAKSAESSTPAVAAAEK